MQANEQKRDSVIRFPKDASTTAVSADISDMISKSPACNEQSIEKLQMENMSESSPNRTDDTCKESRFKKPLLLIGPKRGKIGKIRMMNDNIISASSESSSTNNEATETYHLQEDTKEKIDLEESILKNSAEENILSDTKNIPVPYLEPKWGGKPTEEYKLEVLKSGIIVEKIDLTERSFYILGRLPSCNLPLAHPTISRYHAIIQYRTMEDEKNSKGFYLYDLESTHGTFWNGHRIKPRTYVRLRDGHMIKLGCSQRKYILQAPNDLEEESELSVTQLKEKRLEELRERKIRQQEEEEVKERAKQAPESEGIDWGMGEDADEETDLTENPYASMADEELYLDDPKKTLRGWFEREGYDLQYQVEEKGIGQFLSWINLPKECFGGRSIKAEALVKGKKKESIIQCALEACRILDRHGLLRQANHESRRKKARNWEEEDYYDSDEDNFLDRTGIVERKREQRMKLAGKFEEKIETYSSLTEKHNNIMNKISHLTNRLKEAQESKVKAAESNEDSLDAFMSNLNTSSLSKSDVIKMKVELQNLHKEEIRLVKLINLTKPANLPPLVSQVQAEDKKDCQQQKSKTSMKKISQLEKRKKHFEAKNKDEFVRVQLATSDSNNMDNVEEEEDEEENEDNMKEKIESDITKSSSCKDEIKSQDCTRTNDELCILRGVDMETEERNANIVDDKKRRKDKKSEKSKIMKKQYDQDIHSEDYSTWIPPQDQSGDGRTTLNDKYGY
ncbi:kanadaptin [Cataglyphis hispanica]|uniref:kanadaptin n=1 Tax=Cataglyphis hispanica TaxID=1086592 RepID=UPI00217F46B5|nr:kanadaptin [Cataglyphis hispanica]